jgi:hypothetical protein
MQNVKMTREGDELVIRVDMSTRLGDSKSGKTVMIATTEGNVKVPGAGDVKIGLNIYEPKPKV